jgi:hypothetical protein
MKHVACLLLVLIACKDKDKDKATVGSATAGSGSAKDSAIPGSATRSGSSAVASPTAGSSMGKLVITKNGIGPLQRFNSLKDEKETAALIQKTLEPLLSGITTTVDKMGAEGNEKKSYFSVKRGDKEIVQVLPGLEAVMLAYTPEITTEDGTKVGDTVGDVMPKHASLMCFNDPAEPISGMVRVDVVCFDKAQTGLLYVIDRAGRKLPLTPLVVTDPKAPDHLDLKTISDLKIRAIAGIP